MKSYFTIFILVMSSFYIQKTNAQEISKAETLAIGIAYTYPSYGLSGRYNFTETHSGQVIIGGASYGFGSGSFSATGRYIYNFAQGKSSFIFRPYAFGQLGFNSVTIVDEKSNSMSFGAGGGIEYTFNNFIDNLYFTTEIGFVGGSFGDDIYSYSGFAWGWGIAYRFDI